MEQINYFAAAGYALIGWLVQVTIYYFQFDTDAPFDRKMFWRVYDKYIILGFVASLAIALLGDFAWPTLNEYLTTNLPYDERINIILGSFSTLILLFISRKAKEKFDSKP
jgi:hypothetical protein